MIVSSLVKHNCIHSKSLHLAKHAIFINVQVLCINAGYGRIPGNFCKYISTSGKYLHEIGASAPFLLVQMVISLCVIKSFSSPNSKAVQFSEYQGSRISSRTLSAKSSSPTLLPPKPTRELVIVISLFWGIFCFGAGSVSLVSAREGSA